MHDAIVLALGTPVRVGVYDEQGVLVEEIVNEGVGSDILPLIFEGLLKKYTFGRFVYANGPGSFMGIKVTYLFLKTLGIVKNIPLFAIDGFFFNENSPIKAVGKLYFVKNSEVISLLPLEAPSINGFTLPKTIDAKNFKSDNAPYYGIDAVG
jgi:tRNA A37 threonylcarbamoyladenosine modification protein TsaB